MHFALYIFNLLFLTAAQYSMIDMYNIVHFCLPNNGYSSHLSCFNYCCGTNRPKIYWLKTRTSYCFSWAYGLAIWFYWDRLGILSCGLLWISRELSGLGRPQLAQLSPPPVFFLVIIFPLLFFWCGTGTSCDTNWHPCFVPHLEGSISEV